MRKGFLSALLVSTVAAFPAAAETQGVSDDEVVIGAFQDLSGIFAAFGAPATTAAQMYIEEVNAKGGVHGRKIRYVVEDHGYQVPKAVQAVNKLINRDKVFAMLLSLGTPHNLAAFKVMDKKGIPSVSPLSGARQMLQDPIKNKFASFSSYYDGISAGLSFMAKEKGAKTVCSMYIPSDFGKEIQAGTVDQAKKLGLTYATETTHKPDETDYVGSLGKLKQAGCDTVTLALSVRGTITVVATAKKLGWKDVKFLTSSAGFHTAVAKVPGGITEGLYAGAGWQDLATRMNVPEVAAWVKKYTDRTGEKFPGTGALLGRTAVETFVRALEAAGRDLTHESFIKAMEGLKYEDKIGGAMVDVGADHVSSEKVYISQIQGGNWKLLGEAN